VDYLRGRTAVREQVFVERVFDIERVFGNGCSSNVCSGMRGHPIGDAPSPERLFDRPVRTSVRPPDRPTARPPDRPTARPDVTTSFRSFVRSFRSFTNTGAGTHPHVTSLSSPGTSAG
jgi:hypothetical protein